jgi:hypothetical protein
MPSRSGRGAMLDGGVLVNPQSMAPNLALGTHVVHAVPCNQTHWDGGILLPAHLQNPAAWQPRNLRSARKPSRRNFNSAGHAFGCGEQVFLYQQQQFVSGNGNWIPPVHDNGMLPRDSKMIYGREPSERRTGSHLHTRSG